MLGSRRPGLVFARSHWLLGPSRLIVVIVHAWMLVQVGYMLALSNLVMALGACVARVPWHAAAHYPGRRTRGVGQAAGRTASNSVGLRPSDVRACLRASFRACISVGSARPLPLGFPNTDKTNQGFLGFGTLDYPTGGRLRLPARRRRRVPPAEAPPLQSDPRAVS